MIELKHIYKSYDKNLVLDDLSLKFAEREMVCLIGEMGSGKSTILRCLAGLVKPDAGEIIFTSGIKPRIGMIFQHFNLFSNLNVLHNLTLAPMRVLGLSAKEAERIALEHLESVGLAHKKDLFPSELSIGQQQRVAMARSLVMNPQVLLLDEPLSALDPIATGEVMNVLRKLKKEITLIMSTHKLNAATELADKIVFLDKGKVCEEGTSEEIFVSPRKEETRRFLSYMKDLHYTIESPLFDRPELNSCIEQYCNRFGLGSQAFRFVELAVEESLNLVPLENGAKLLLSKVENEVRMSLDITVNDMGISYIDEKSCRDDLSLNLLQGICDILEERIKGNKRILHMELNQERLLLK
ncbi:MAG: amino acid ABC transporter ATP-binding protein [Bacteroidaceae bacterium]|nr:amino acid ABC transporter ATP-binding protein [Bacteroidaceae bacterium]